MPNLRKPHPPQMVGECSNYLLHGAKRMKGEPANFAPFTPQHSMVARLEGRNFSLTGWRRGQAVMERQVTSTCEYTGKITGRYKETSLVDEDGQVKTTVENLPYEP